MITFKAEVNIDKEFLIELLRLVTKYDKEQLGFYTDKRMVKVYKHEDACKLKIGLNSLYFLSLIVVII